MSDMQRLHNFTQPLILGGNKSLQPAVVVHSKLSAIQTAILLCNKRNTDCKCKQEPKCLPGNRDFCFSLPPSLLPLSLPHMELFNHFYSP